MTDQQLPPPPGRDDLRRFLDAIGARRGMDVSLFHGGTAEVFAAHCGQSEKCELLELSLVPPDDLTIYKSGTRSIVGARALVSGGMAVLKYYEPKTPVKRLTYGILGSRSRRAWLASLAFSSAGIPTPPAMLHVEWKSAGGLCWNRSFLATRRAPGMTLRDWVSGRDSDEVAAVAGKLRDIVARMGALHIYHGDMKATNIMVDEQGGISLVDLDAAVVLASNEAWPRLRARDRAVFDKNWRHSPHGIRSAFTRVFNDGHNCS